MKPRVFIGSTTEGKPYAQIIQKSLVDICEARLWTKPSIFEVGGNIQQSLIKEIRDSDFVVMIMTADDKLRLRGKEFFSPRDNLIFEAGMSFGANSSERTIIVPQKAPSFRLPSDLEGFITTEAFQNVGSPKLALKGAIAQIRDVIKRKGLRSNFTATIPKSQVIEESIEIIRQSSRSVIMIGRDLSWVGAYRIEMESAIKDGKAVTVICDRPNSTDWEDRIGIIRSIGGTVKYSNGDLGIRMTMIDHHDQDLVKLMLISKTRKPGGVSRKRGGAG